MQTLSASEKLARVERALWEGVAPKPDNEAVIEPGWVQQTHPKAPTAFMNGVYRCELDDASAPDRVRRAVAHFRELKLPFRWKVCPSTRPINIPSLLEAEGLALKETLYGLIAEPGQLSFPVNPHVKVEALRLENLEDWLQVQATAWNVPPPGITYIRNSMTESLKQNDQAGRNFLAYLEGKPVASAAFRYFSGYAFLQGGAVNPDARRQGVYRSLLAHRLELVGKAGLPAVVHCLENTSAPICLKLGFEKICEIQSYEPV
jgi:hypothetical protein